jgi:hypothetical protein
MRGGGADVPDYPWRKKPSPGMDGENSREFDLLRQIQAFQAKT